MAGKEFELVLTEPIKISVPGGEFQEEQVILVSAPPIGSSKAKTKAIKLKSMALSGFGILSRAAEEQTEKLDESEKEEAVKEAEIDIGDTLLEQMAFYGVDITPMVELVGELAPVILKVGENIKFESVFWNMKISGDDQIRIAGVFIRNFSLASIFSKPSVPKNS